MNENSSKLVELAAKTYMDFMESNHPGWGKAFFRFNVNRDSNHGGNGSYTLNDTVQLISSLKNKEICSKLISTLYHLWGELDKKNKSFLVCLLIIDSDFNFKILFEQNDMNKWTISKMDGASGIPSEYDEM